jgi:hypothetical protein
MPLDLKAPAGAPLITPETLARTQLELDRARHVPGLVYASPEVFRTHRHRPRPVG